MVVVPRKQAVPAEPIPQQRLNAMPQLVPSVGGTVLGQLQRSQRSPAPDHRSVASNDHRGWRCFGMGHHPLNRDLLRAPAPAAGNGSGLGTEAVDWGLWVGTPPMQAQDSATLLRLRP